LIPIRSNQLDGLEWRQPAAFAREYELHCGDSVLARLVWRKAIGTLAAAETSGANWTFKRTGFLTSVITARVSGSDIDIAYYEPNWSGAKGQLRIGGQALQLKSANFWASRWVLTHEETPLLEFGSHGVLKAGAAVTVHDAARQRADLPLLLCFVWYILLLHMEDASTAAIIAT